MILSGAASPDKGIATAEAAGITLIGFSRGDRFPIYTHPARVFRPGEGRSTTRRLFHTPG